MGIYYEYFHKHFLQVFIFIATCWLFPFSSIYAAEQDSLLWLTDFAKAKQLAQKESKYILIYFSGSDWCKPCIKMKKEIFETPAFKDFAKKNMICVLADFPRYKKNKLPKEQSIHNETLAEKYNREGIFPHTVLTDATGHVLNKTTYQAGGPELFINYLSKYITRENKAFKKAFAAMGSPFEITAVATNTALAEKAIDVAEKEISRIEKLISSWDAYSQTSAINSNAGKKPVKVDIELFGLIKRCKKVSSLTNGAFDISFASIDKIWRFDGTMKKIPSPDSIAASIEKINYQNIILNKNDTSIFLTKEGIKISFGAIGKGYATNKARDVMKSMGIANGIVNAGGDLFAWGRQANGEQWKIGIADPKNKNKIMAWLQLENTAIVTSGNYERFVLIDGKKYAHIIDPRTGYPVSGLKSVSIICPDAELADALATAIFVMGEDSGMQLIDQLENIEGIIVNEQDEIFISKNLKLEYK